MNFKRFEILENIGGINFLEGVIKYSVRKNKQLKNNIWYDN